MNFTKQYESYVSAFNEYAKLQKFKGECNYKNIYQAMEYSFYAGGKRIRPVLCMASYNMFAQDIIRIMPVAFAIERIHTYSLIHDDLPIMDNDDLRRGRPTCHKVFGEKIAFLAGDGLLNSAFETLSNFIVNSDDMVKASKAVALISKASGCDGMIGGQVIDIESENKEIEKELILEMYEKKTSALLYASVCSGAIVGGADDQQVAKLKQFSVNLGLAFQIKDDILDIEGDEKLLGKPVGSDCENKKSTIVQKLGLAEAKKLCSHYTDIALESINDIENNEFLKELAKKLIERNC